MEQAETGAAPAALAAMIDQLRGVLTELCAVADERTAGFAEAEAALLARARGVGGRSSRLIAQFSGTSTATTCAGVSPEFRQRCSTHDGKCRASPAATT